MKSFINRYQIAFFFLLTFGLSWFPWYAGIAPEVMTLGPSIAAFLLALIIGGWRGLVELVRPFGHWWLVLVYGELRFWERPFSTLSASVYI